MQLSSLSAWSWPIAVAGLWTTTVVLGKAEREVEFSLLAGFAVPAETLSTPGALLAVTPPPIRALHGRVVQVRGYMLPLSLEGDRVSTFLLLPNTLACCFGQTPQINQWVLVDAPSPAALLLDVPLFVQGEFQVGEWMEQDNLVALYRLQASTVTLAP